MGRLLIAAPHKSSGKTTITLGLCAALRAEGIAVQPFKKGPDYIDPMWLAQAAGRPCYNLDFNTMDATELKGLFASRSADARIALVEGNMGLFDSVDVEGTQSNASLAALLGLPVILVIDVRGATRSILPLILGFANFDPAITIAGLILNNVAGARHEQRLREAIARYTDIPVVGALHRDRDLVIDERHLGLIPSHEAHEAEALLERITSAVARQVDLKQLMRLADNAQIGTEEATPVAIPPKADLRIGYAHDRAFGFYYADDLETFRQLGAEMVPIDCLADSALPEIDGLLLGGGFPETQMDGLEANIALRSAIKTAIDDGLPCYAECGGLMYLARSLEWDGRRTAMCGVLPLDITMQEKPVGRGVMRLSETANHPWPLGNGSSVAVHEFHYSRPVEVPDGFQFAYQVERGSGIDGTHDGIVYRNLLANYAHLRHTDRTPWIARFLAFVRANSFRKTTG